MDSPAKLMFEADTEDGPFSIGCNSGMWGLVDQPPYAAWPTVKFWIKAAERPGSPDRYVVALNLENYRADRITGWFWDMEQNQTLADRTKWPKGKAGTRVDIAFRQSGWSSYEGKAFYHPYDRIAWKTHSNWGMAHAEYTWTSEHTVTDFLDMLHKLLNSGDYLGIK